MFKKLFAGAVLSAALIAGLTACGTSGAPSSDSKPAAAQTQTSSPSATPASQNAKFGQSYKWKDGVEVTISAAQPYTPTSPDIDAIAGGPATDKDIIFKITLKNGSNANVDASIAQLSLTSGGTAAINVADIQGAAGIGMGPSTPILPGQSVSWNAAFRVSNPADLTGQFTLTDFDHQPAIFTN
jgi:hypothetical protein